MYATANNVGYLIDNSYTDFKFNNGTADWAHLSRDIGIHEQSKKFKEVMNNKWSLLSLEVELTVDGQHLSEIKTATHYWEIFLRRIVDNFLTLATNDIASTEHRLLDDPSVSKGNFLRIIHLVAWYDDILSDLLKRQKHSVKYLSPAV